MKEDLLIRMYQLLDNDPDSAIVTEYESECTSDPTLRQTWYDFLAEQLLSGNLTDTWKNSITSNPQIKPHIEFQQQVQSGIRAIQDRNTKTEIREILPKRTIDGIHTSGRNSRFILFVASVAAVALLCIGILTKKLWIGDSSDTKADIVPIVMIEEFESEGVTEAMLVHGIPQRIPSKLAAAAGIYLVTYYAVDHATDRAKTGETTHGILNADYAMRGKVQRRGSDYLVEASLVDVEKNRELWKALFPVEDNPKAFDDLHDELSMKVAQILNVAINKDAHARLTREVSHDIEAMNLFLAGERMWSERTDSSLLAAIHLFQLALERDEMSTTIRGYLALAYDTYAENGYGDSTHWALALSEAERTLAVDPQNPEALVVKGDYAESVEKNYKSAREYFNQALKVQPGDAKIHQAIAELYLRTGDITEGTDHIRTARAIEPEHRVVRWVETKYLTATGRLAAAKDAAEDLLAMYPGYPNIQNFFWQYHLSRQEYQLALVAIPKSRPQSVQNYMQAMVYLDQKDYAGLHALYPDQLPNSFVLLEHVQRDEWNEAYEFLRKLLEQGEFELIAISQSSDFLMLNKMKQDSGIQQILANYNIKVNIIPEDLGLEI